jgi:CheY-like chemotaxis protein
LERMTTARSRPGREFVLIAEDNDDLAMLLADYFESRGYEVAKVANGKTAIDLISDAAPSVLVVDIGLPEIDGLAVARHARKLFGATLPIVAITGYSTAMMHARAWASQCDAVLLKPFDFITLIETIERIRASALSS